MFANIPVSCNWQLQEAVKGADGSAEAGAAAEYAPAPGVRKPCEITVHLWQLENQGGATSIRIRSSARTYELYSKLHSGAGASYVASFRGKETDQPGIFSVKIPLQESCNRASDAILRLLSIRDKTRLELHHFSLEVPGARGGLLEATDSGEHSLPEPIGWNEGLAALAPKSQSQAAQIRGMLQSALQPGAGNGNINLPSFARSAPPAQLMQAIARAAMASQAMPALPPIASMKLPLNGTAVHPPPNHAAPADGLTSAAASLPSAASMPPALPSIASLASPDILPLLQSISSRLQRTDDRIARIESALGSRSQNALPSAASAAHGDGAAAAGRAAASEAAAGESATESAGPAVPDMQQQAPGAAIPDSPGGNGPFANSSQLHVPLARRQSEPNAVSDSGDSMAQRDGSALQHPPGSSPGSSMMISPFANGPAPNRPPQFQQELEAGRPSSSGQDARHQVPAIPDLSSIRDELCGQLGERLSEQLSKNLSEKVADQMANQFLKLRSELAAQLTADITSSLATTFMDLTSDLSDRLRHSCSEDSAGIRQAVSRSEEAAKAAVASSAEAVGASCRAQLQEHRAICEDLRSSCAETRSEVKDIASAVHGLDAKFRPLEQIADQGTERGQSMMDFMAKIWDQATELTGICNQNGTLLQEAASETARSRADIEARIKQLEDACEENRNLLRRALPEESQRAMPAMQQSLETLSNQVAEMSGSLTSRPTEFEQRLQELEAACKENGTLLRQALASRPTAPAVPPTAQSLQDLSDQARGRPLSSRSPAMSPVGSPRESNHGGSSRSSSPGSRESGGESSYSWHTPTAELSSQASTHASSSASSPRAQQPPAPKMRGRWALPNL